MPSKEQRRREKERERSRARRLANACNNIHLTEEEKAAKRRRANGPNKAEMKMQNARLKDRIAELENELRVSRAQNEVLRRRLLREEVMDSPNSSNNARLIMPAPAQTFRLIAPPNPMPNLIIRPQPGSENQNPTTEQFVAALEEAEEEEKDVALLLNNNKNNMATTSSSTLNNVEKIALLLNNNTTTTSSSTTSVIEERIAELEVQNNALRAKPRPRLLPKTPIYRLIAPTTSNHRSVAPTTPTCRLTAPNSNSKPMNLPNRQRSLENKNPTTQFVAALEAAEEERKDVALVNNNNMTTTTSSSTPTNASTSASSGIHASRKTIIGSKQKQACTLFSSEQGRKIMEENPPAGFAEVSEILAIECIRRQQRRASWRKLPKN